VFPTMIVNQKKQSIQPPKYWGVSSDHANDIVEMVSTFYKPLEKFYGDITTNNVLNEIKTRTKAYYLLSIHTPVNTKTKIEDKEIYSPFEKRMVTLLYEYYFLNILNEYIMLTKDSSMVARMLAVPEADPNDENAVSRSSDFLIEQQLRFTEDEQEFVEGDVIKLKQNTAKLLVAYLNIMMRCKKTINMSFQDVEDKVFKLKEAEKYTFTDRLRDMTDEERTADTILKHHKLGPLYSIGLSKGIKEYDPENFDHDKQVAEKVAEIQNRLRRQQVSDRDIDMEMDDALAEADEQRNIDMDLAFNVNHTDDFDDGDPWGEEGENDYEYD